jgi:FKBP-type peptidyl-prolyl cis-trans isomerase FklB
MFVKEQKRVSIYKMKSHFDTINYAMGVEIGRQIKKYGIKNLEYKYLLRGIKDAVEKKSYDLAIEPKIAKSIVSLYVTKELNEKIVSYIDKNRRFLRENARKKGVKVLPNGLQYKIIKKGIGASPKLTSIATVEYIGELVNGDVFVSTPKGKTVSFEIKNSLKGWQTALTRMKRGSEWIIYLPPQLAFGSRGTSKVPPNSVVIYKIKLVKFK